MKKTLPIFLTVGALIFTFQTAAQQTPLATQPAPSGAEQTREAQQQQTTGQGNPIASPEGQALAKRAIVAVDAQRSLYLQLRQRINMFGQQLVGNGYYQQAGQREERKLRLDLKVNIANQSTSMQQVCDSRFLYIRRDFGDIKSLGRVDLRRIRQAVDASPAADGNLDVSQQWMLLGGLPQLLARLEANFQFTAPKQAMLENTQVSVIEGFWKPEALLALLPEHSDAIKRGEPIGARALSKHLPTQIRLVVRRDDSFPVRIEYLRSGKAASPDQPPPVTTIMAMEFYDIRSGVEIDPLTFVYNPGNEEVADHTEIYLNSLGLKNTRQATREDRTPR